MKVLPVDIRNSSTSLRICTAFCVSTANGCADCSIDLREASKHISYNCRSIDNIGIMKTLLDAISCKQHIGSVRFYKIIGSLSKYRCTNENTYSLKSNQLTSKRTTCGTFARWDRFFLVSLNSRK